MMLCKNCGHEIEKSAFGIYLHKSKKVPSRFPVTQANNIITYFCGCDSPKSKRGVKSNE